MSRSARRILITFALCLVAFGIVYAVANGPNKARSGATSKTGGAATAPATTLAAPASSAANPPSAASAPQSPASATQPMEGLAAQPVESDFNGGAALQPVGSLDWRVGQLQLQFSLAGAGIDAIPLSGVWDTAEARRKAESYAKTLRSDEPIDHSKLDESQRYVLQRTQPLLPSVMYNGALTPTGKSYSIPVLAAHSIVINNASVVLLSEKAWSQTGPGTFQTRIVDASGRAVAEITRQYLIRSDFDFTLKQRVRNLTDEPLQVRWQQYGPPELKAEGYIDRRRFDFGYLPEPKTDPSLVLADDSSLVVERSSVIKSYERAMAPGLTSQQVLEAQRLWPNKTSVTRGYGLSWFAATGRYFGLCIHPTIDASGAGERSLDKAIEEIRLDVSNAVDKNNSHVFTFLVSPLTTIAPQGEANFDMGVYAGPLNRHLLNGEPYDDLAMYGMIVYRMGSCCSFLTFQWLAKLLLGFLGFLHDYIVFDWGLAIIGLVIVVRTLLHPITKRSQVNMQRFAKQMSSMKPEIDKLQKKYPNDPKRVQQEQMALMREHGVNPLQMLGCAPLFLQTPIWIALWAMLYLAFDIRQQPAFYGVFQLFNGWSFLGDLSSQDGFFRLPGGGFTLPVLGTVTSINLLPLLMGVVFFLQQKYLTPPPTPNMTPEQIQQQKIMKVMTVVMMPLFLYNAPCGLTLYMTTSSCIGILESRYIRKHVTELELNPPKKKESRLAKLRDPIARAYAKKLEEAQNKRRNDEPPQKFKKRK